MENIEYELKMNKRMKIRRAENFLKLVGDTDVAYIGTINTQNNSGYLFEVTNKGGERYCVILELYECGDGYQSIIHEWGSCKQEKERDMVSYYINHRDEEQKYAND